MPSAPLRALALAAFCLALAPRAGAQPAGAPPDLLFQGFHWNAHPGDLGSPFFGVWWDSLATVAPDLAALGVQTVWIPSPAKGGGGRYSMGYDLYDYYDLGTNFQKGGTRTRFGKRSQLDAMLAALQANGLRTMADVVLNHRDGGDAQAEVACVPGGGAPFLKYNVFSPGSGRLPGVPSHFHANPTHCDYSAPYHDEPFGQDLCYFDGLDQTLDAAAPNGGWYHGTHSLGAMGDSLVAWGRWLIDDLGVDEVRVDAVKHIEPGFLAPWLTELAPGDQPFAVGEFFGGTGEIRGYHDAVEGFNPSGGRPARLAMFDFGLRFALKGMADGGGFYDMRELGTAGLLATGLDPFSVVTFVDNHDFDRIGWQGADCSDPDAVPFGSGCLKLGVDSGHDPVVARKHLAYAYTLAAEGRPTVWWKDVFWFGLGREIEWLASLRRLTAQGGSAPMAALHPNGEADQQDLFVLRRDGFGEPRYGALVALNDNGAAERGAWVDSPHADYELRDYSGRYLFETTRAFADGRAYVKAPPGNYAWYAPTGLYPRPVDEPPSSFAVGAEPGGQLHHLVLRAADAAAFRVNGAPIEAGDEVAVLGPDGSAAAGLGRVGQRLRWTPGQDMLLDVVGNADGTTAGGRLAQGAPLRLAVWDASEGTVALATAVTWGAVGAPLAVDPLRPAAAGTPFDLVPTDAGGLFVAGGLSVVRAFEATEGGVPLAQAQLDGEDGWRMLASPVAGSYDALLGPLWTQGFPGADAPDGGCTAYTYVPTAGSFEGGYVCLPAADAAWTPGTGALVYVYADDDPTVPGVQGGFPKTLSASGVAQTLPFDFALAYQDDDRPADEEGWNLLGVPTAGALSWLATERDDVLPTVYVYDPAFNGGDYRSWTDDGASGFGDLAAGEVPPFSGFFVQAQSGSAALRAVAGPAPERSSAGAALRLALSDDTGERSAAWVGLVEGASAERDGFDAPRLEPTAWPRAVVATADPNGAPLLVNALPPDLGAPLALDLALDLTGHAGDVPLELSWGDLAGAPAGWTFRLVDRQTGAVTTLAPGERYAFVADAGEAEPARVRRPLGAPLRASGAARFELRVEPAGAVGTDAAAPAETALRLVAPNPTRGALRVGFALAESGAARVELLDVTGRRVALLADGARAAGEHTVTVDAGTLSAGVYLVRLVAGDRVFLERAVVLR